MECGVGIGGVGGIGSAVICMGVSIGIGRGIGSGRGISHIVSHSRHTLPWNNDWLTWTLLHHHMVMTIGMLLNTLKDASTDILYHPHNIIHIPPHQADIMVELLCIEFPKMKVFLCG